MGGPRLPDFGTKIKAGIDPKTGLPIRLIEGNCSKYDIKKFLRIIDEQDAVNRYVWYNLPCNLSSQELERMIYYKGQLAFFYYEPLNEFYFMPYALDGTIDFYGRFNTIHPVPMANGTDEKADKAQEQLLSDLKLTVIKGIKLDPLTENDLLKSCVLLHDYTKQLSQSILPRQQINEPLLDVMAECVPYMSTNLLLSTGIKGIRVPDADTQHNVNDAGNAMKDAALCNNPFMPIIGNVDFQDLAEGAVAKSEEYMLAMQSLDNLRLSGYGIDNGGLFEKKAHTLQTEADINGGPVGLVLADGLAIRQNFCNIVNSIWGIGIWCEVNENISGADLNGDGMISEENNDGMQNGVEGGTDNGNETEL